MTANELWNGFYFVGGTGTLTNGAVRISDASTVDGIKYETEVLIKGGDKLEFNVMARAISGIGHLYSIIGAETEAFAEVDITGSDEWRAYKLEMVVPLYYNVVKCVVGVSVYSADIGEIEARLPTIKINGKEPVAKTTQTGFRAAPGNDDAFIVTDGRDVARVFSDGTFSFKNPGATSFPVDPPTAAVDGLTIGGGTQDGVIRSHHLNYDAAVWGRGSVGVVHRFLYVTGPGVSTGVGNINITSTATNYQTTSDYRVKENAAELTGSGNFIDSLQPKTWTWAIDGSTGVGFIAHELQAASPTSVSGEKDAVDENGVPILQGVSYGSAELIANIVAELKSLRQRVAALESM